MRSAEVCGGGVPVRSRGLVAYRSRILRAGVTSLGCADGEAGWRAEPVTTVPAPDGSVTPHAHFGRAACRGGISSMPSAESVLGIRWEGCGSRVAATWRPSSAWGSGVLRRRYPQVRNDRGPRQRRPAALHLFGSAGPCLNLVDQAHRESRVHEGPVVPSGEEQRRVVRLHPRPVEEGCVIRAVPSSQRTVPGQ